MKLITEPGKDEESKKKVISLEKYERLKVLPLTAQELMKKGISGYG